jgi:hypothetical protein
MPRMQAVFDGAGVTGALGVSVGVVAGALDAGAVDGVSLVGVEEPPGVVAGVVAGLVPGGALVWLPEGVALGVLPGVAVPLDVPGDGAAPPAGAEAGLETLVSGCDGRPSGVPLDAGGDAAGPGFPWSAVRSPPPMSRTSSATTATMAAPTTSVVVRSRLRRCSGGSPGPVSPPGMLAGIDSRSGTAHSSE